MRLPIGVISATIDGLVSDVRAVPLRESTSLVHPVKAPFGLAWLLV